MRSSARQARRGRAAERVERALDAPLLVRGELRRAREVDRAHAPLAAAVGGGLLGQAALLRGVDERRDRVGGEDLAAHAAHPHRRSARRDGAAHAPSAPGRRDGHAPGCRASTRTVRPARAAGVGRGDGDAQRARAPRARPRRCARRRRGRRRREREHAGAADEHGLEARCGARRAATIVGDQRVDRGVGELAGRRRVAPDDGGQHDVGQAGDGRPAVEQREADARAQAERDEHVARAPAETANSPIRTMVSAMRYDPRPRRARSSSHAAARRDEQEGDRAVLALDREVGVQHERDVVARARGRPARRRRSRRACPWPTAAAPARARGRSWRPAR